MGSESSQHNETTEHYDALVIGAGVSGMYALHHFRELGLSVKAFDGASDVGGTWWYNRYPGARVDGPGSPFYCYSFSEELMQEWDWAETQSEQSAVLEYLEHVASKFDLRRDIEFNTWVTGAHYDEAIPDLDHQHRHRRSGHCHLPHLCVRGTVDNEQTQHSGYQRFRWRVLSHRPLAP